MARPIVLPWDFSTFTGLEPITTMSDEFTALKVGINDSANGFVNYIADTGVVNSVVLTLASPPIAYQPGMTVSFVAAVTNTGASLINVNSLGTVNIVDVQGNPLKAGALIAGQISTLIYNGTAFMLTYRYPYLLNAPFSGNVNVDASGVSSLTLSGGITVASTIVITNLVNGVHIMVSCSNSSGSAKGLAVQAAAPFNGQSDLRYTATGGTVSAINMQVSQLSIATGLFLKMQGSVVGTFVTWFGILG